MGIRGTARKITFELLTRHIQPLLIPLGGQTGVSMVTCHDHVYMSLFSLHSFFFFLRKPLPCTIIDDGTLTNKDKNLFHSHFPGITLIDGARSAERVCKMLTKYPYCQKNRCSVWHSSYTLKLFDPILLAPYEKIILMDSDVIFLKTPSRILRWIQADDHKSLFARHFIHPNYAREDVDIAWLIILRMFIERINPKVDFGFNSGFICLSKKYFNLARVETLMHYCYRVGLESTWAPEQYIFSTLIAEAPHEYLGKYYVHTHSSTEYRRMVKNPFDYVLIHFAYLAKHHFFPLAISILLKTRLFQKRFSYPHESVIA